MSTEKHELIHRDTPAEIATFVSRDRVPTWPRFPFPTDRTGMHAKCPKCGRITSIRVCYGCKELMCEECLLEHQIVCLHKGKKK